MKNTCVLLSTCDKYSWAWPVWKQMFEKYWPVCPYDIFWVTNFKSGLKGLTINVGDVPWSDGMKTALETIPHDNIIFLLEDYWFTQPVNTKGLEELCYILDTSLIEHIRLYVSKGSKKIKRQSFATASLDILNNNEDYRCALNVGIWKRQVFLDLLTPNTDIWTSEHSMTDKSRNRLFATVQEMKYIVYDINKNMIEQGKLTNHGKEYIQQEGYHLA